MALPAKPRQYQLLPLSSEQRTDITMQSNEIWRSYGTDHKDMTKRLLSACSLAEEIRKKCGGKTAAPRIAIKPNLVNPSPAEFGATTHPEVVSGIIEYLTGEGFTELFILEGSWIGDRTSEAFRYCGYEALSEQYGIPLIDTQKDEALLCDCAGMPIRICKSALDADFLINVPVLKGHGQTRITCALKNMKGVIPNTEKRRFHAEGLHKPIACLNRHLHQDFIVVDHICGDPESEDGGHPLTKNCVMAGKDPVLMDAYVAGLLGWQPEQIEYITRAASLGIGSADLSGLKLITTEGTPDETIPRTFRITELSLSVDQVESCSACYAMLTEALDRLEQEGLLADLPDKICIGQGFRGKTGLLGVGNCTAAFTHTVPGCPPEAEDIYHFLKTYIADHRKEAGP